MKTNHLDVIFMEQAARRRGYSPSQLRAALNAYEHGGLSARRLLASLGLIPKAPEPEPEMTPEELLTLERELTPESDPTQEDGNSGMSAPLSPPAPPA